MHRAALNSSRRSTSGFSLTELMIAMAIFLILMSGLATLFNSAVTSARTGYASIDAYQDARAVIQTIDRDLSGAFVSNEFGEVYNFYGRPDGFMFVGTLDGGELGRVTYVFHPEQDKGSFETTITEQWQFVEEKLRRQYRRIAWENGYFGNTAILIADAAVAELVAAYGAPLAPTDLYTFSVRIETESMIRFEEAGKADLDTFDMRLDSAGAVNLVWPYVDPLNPSFDAATVDTVDDTDNQLEFLVSALDPTPGIDPNDDLRNIYFDINQNGGWAHPVTSDVLYPRILGRDAFDTLLQARKREFWLRMLSGDNMYPNRVILDLLPDTANGLSGYWYDEGYGVPNALDHRVVNEYVVADGIIARAVILTGVGGFSIQYPAAPSNGAPALPAGQPQELDALDAYVKFSYGDSESGSVYYFNAAENLTNPDIPDGSIDSDSDGTVDYLIPNLPTLLRTTTGLPWADVIEADNTIAENHLSEARSTRDNLGSPLLPKLPQVVTPELWITRSKTRPGAPDFRRRFVQGIQVPSARGRTPSTIIAQSPGQSL